jgi:hypothetical protein
MRIVIHSFVTSPEYEKLFFYPNIYPFTPTYFKISLFYPYLTLFFWSGILLYYVLFCSFITFSVNCIPTPKHCSDNIVGTNPRNGSPSIPLSLSDSFAGDHPLPPSSPVSCSLLVFRPWFIASLTLDWNLS